MKSLILILLLLFTYNLSWSQEYRTLDGSNNNLANPEWGMAGYRLQQVCRINFGDLISTPAGGNRPNERMISNVVFGQEDFIPSPQNISDFGWGFGQFLDHDITFSIDSIDEFVEIPIPSGDLFFDPNNTGTQKMIMRRTDFDRSSGVSTENPRRPVNSISSWIDASAVYGISQERADWLRTGLDGKLKTSSGNLLPYNTTTGEYDAPVDTEAPFMVFESHENIDKFFVAGDIRANEQPGLLSFHNLFVLEHNRQCDELIQDNPSWDDQRLYMEARKRVAALIQVITYEEFLPALGLELGENTGYDPQSDGSIMNIFSGAAYRLGHSMVNDQIIRLTETGDAWSFGSIQIKDAFFNADILREEGGIEPLFRGMLTQAQQKFDNKVVGTLRNFLFGPPGSGGLDLMVLNIARGRERGLPDYNSVREDFGLSRNSSFDQITDDTELQTSLEEIYVDTDDMDVWVGMVSETPEEDDVVGELMKTVLTEQFQLLRKGDRFYYENDPALSSEEIAELKSTRLSHIITRNTDIKGLPEDVFHVSDYPSSIVSGIQPFRNIRKIDVSVFPNPAVDNFKIAISSRTIETATLEITDYSGRLIENKELNLQRGENLFSFTLDEQVISGLYIITMRTSDGIGQLKLVKR